MRRSLKRKSYSLVCMVVEERGMQRLSACKGALQRKGDGGGGNQSGCVNNSWLHRRARGRPASASIISPEFFIQFTILDFYLSGTY